MRFSCCVLSVVLLVAGGTACAAGADEPAKSLDVAGLLSRRVIDPDRPLAEVQAFTEKRVPVLRPFADVKEWEREAKRIRQGVLTHVVFRGEAARWQMARTRVQWLDVLPGKGYRIRKLRYEAVPGLWIPALLYEPATLKGKVPVVLNVNGHDGKGKAAPYKQIRCINMAKRGMLALNVEWYGMGQLRQPGFVHYRLNQLDLCGTSGVSLFYLSMKRGLDVLLSHQQADPQRVAVAGLSGGGWQTIFISSLDERVTLSNPVAGYSGFRTRARYLSDLGDSEQTPVDLAVYGDYAQLTALRAPRPTLLTNNANDNCCFKAEHALPPLVETALPIFRLYHQAGNLRTHVNHNPGTHNFEKDNREALYRMLGDHFFATQPFDPAEIPCERELKNSEQLAVELPADNLDFHKIALQLSRHLPRARVAAESADAFRHWQQQGRQRLRKVLRYHAAEVIAVPERTQRIGQTTVHWWWLRVGTEWTVPGVEIVPPGAKGTVIVLADDGRAAAAEKTRALLQQGFRVLAIDPFYLGESKIAKRDFLFGLLVSAVGERPLGVQSAQIAAVARWMKQREPQQPVTVSASGPRTSLMALCAGGLEEAIDALSLDGSYSSLRDILEQDLTVQQAPELFCFGLLEQFDLPELTALVIPRRVTFTHLTGRHHTRLKETGRWYRLLGKKHHPLGTTGSKTP